MINFIKIDSGIISRKLDSLYRILQSDFVETGYLCVTRCGFFLYEIEDNDATQFTVTHYGDFICIENDLVKCYFYEDDIASTRLAYDQEDNPSYLEIMVK